MYTYSRYMVANYWSLVLFIEKMDRNGDIIVNILLDIVYKDTIRCSYSDNVIE